jgi:hypothetical protein
VTVDADKLHVLVECREGNNIAADEPIAVPMAE